MDVVDKATETQLKNIQTRTGKSLDELFAFIRETGLAKHGEIRERVKSEFGLGHGDANLLATLYGKAQAPAPGEGQSADPRDSIYSGLKASLRPVHEKVLAAVTEFGPFEIAPKKGYVSLRRKKQFAIVGPGTRGRLEIGLNGRGMETGDRLAAEPPGGMCQYKVHLTDAAEVDDELVDWLRTAYDAAG